MLLDATFIFMRFHYENCTWQDYSGPGHTREIMASVTLIFSFSSSSQVTTPLSQTLISTRKLLNLI